MRWETDVSTPLSTWEPIWWEPVLDPRADLFLTLRLYNLQDPSSIKGARLYLNATQFPVEVVNGYVRVHLTPDQVATIPHGADARLYLDLDKAGTFLWLSGKVAGGGRR